MTSTNISIRKLNIAKIHPGSFSLILEKQRNVSNYLVKEIIEGSPFYQMMILTYKEPEFHSDYNEMSNRAKVISTFLDERLCPELLMFLEASKSHFLSFREHSVLIIDGDLPLFLLDSNLMKRIIYNYSQIGITLIWRTDNINVAIFYLEKANYLFCFQRGYNSLKALGKNILSSSRDFMKICDSTISGNQCLVIDLQPQMIEEKLFWYKPTSTVASQQTTLLPVQSP